MNKGQKEQSECCIVSEFMIWQKRAEKLGIEILLDEEGKLDSSFQIQFTEDGAEDFLDLETVEELGNYIRGFEQGVARAAKRRGAGKGGGVCE